jgi:hypothetical protein
MRRSHDRYNDVEPSSPPQSSPDYTIVIRGYNFREGQGYARFVLTKSQSNAPQALKCLGSIVKHFKPAEMLSDEATARIGGDGLLLPHREEIQETGERQQKPDLSNRDTNACELNGRELAQ